MAVIKPLAFCITQKMIDAGLKGNKLVVYAYLEYKAYNMNGWYKDGIKAICNTLHLTEPTVIKSINDLIKEGFIEKQYFLDNNNIKRCSLRPL